LVRMMAPKASGNAVLGRHHPPVVPPYGDGNNSRNDRVYDSGSIVLRENPVVRDGYAKHKCWPSK